MIDPITLAVLAGHIMTFAGPIVVALVSKGLPIIAEKNRQKERKMQSETEEKQRKAKEEREEFDKKTDREFKRAQVERDLELERQNHLNRYQDLQQRLQDQQKEFDRRMQDQQEKQDHQNKLLREELEKEKQERKEGYRCLATKSECLKLIGPQIIKLYLYMLRGHQESRASTSTIQNQDNQTYAKLVSDLGLPGEADDVNKFILSAFNQSLPKPQGSSQSTNYDGDELSLVEVPEQLPKGVEDELLNSVMAMIDNGIDRLVYHR